MGARRELARSRAVRLTLAGVMVVAAAAAGISFLQGPSTYPIKVVYSSAPGLFPGAAVDVLGVPVGTVTSVTNVDDHVDVSMAVDSGTRIPSSVDASLVAPQLLGQPDVDLNPGYTHGPQLSPGQTIPVSHTSIPVSTDELLKELQRALKALNPHAVGDLIANLSQDLDGQGAALNALINSAAGTVQLLADKGDDLGQLNGTLAQLTGTLDSDTSQIEQLVQEYDTVSTVLAQHSGQLNDAITQLSGASTALANLLTPNLQPLESDVGTVTTAGRTLDRNLGNVDEILAQGNSLFQGAARVYDPTYNWLNLNLALPAGVTGDYVVGLVRDRLAGVCRRITANHPTGLSSSELASLTSCGNPNSSFFDPLFGDIPGILSSLSDSSTSSSVTGLLQQGLNAISSIGAPSGDGTKASPASPPASAPPPATAPSTTTTTTTTPLSSSLCTLLSSLLPCPASGSTSGGPSSNSTSSGLGGLLSDKVSPSGEGPAQANLAVAPGAPSLTAPAAALLPPLPSTRHTHRTRRGLLAQWMHDIGSWL